MRAAEQLIADKLTPAPNPPQADAAPEPQPPDATTPKRIDYTLIFTRMAQVLRIATTMQTRFMASKPEAETKAIKPWPFHMDPRSEPLRAALDQVVTDHPNECLLRINAKQRADSELIWDCFQDIPLETLYDRIVADMGLKTTFADLPPEFQKPAFQKPQLRIPEP